MNIHKVVTSLFSIILLWFIGFLVFESLKISRALKLNGQSIHYSLDYKYDSALSLINKAIELKHNNPTFYANRGLIYERIVERNFIDYHFLKAVFNWSANENSQIIKSIRQYKKSISLNPYDDIFYHNLGWLYLYIGNTDSAFFYIDKSIEMSPNTSIYHVSRGIMLERKGNLKAAFAEYKHALRLKPIILNSEFYKDLLLKYPKQTDSITKTVIIEFSSLIDSTGSPIYKSRLGSFYFYCGQIEKARNILNETVKQLSNLNRPLFFLGKISENEHHDSLACIYYKKSLFLDPNDYIVNLNLGDYYYRNKDTVKAIQCYTNSLYNIINMSSDHAERNWKMYHVNALPNDIIPGRLLMYCSVFYPYKEVFTRLANLYNQQNSSRKSSNWKRNLKRVEHYRNLTIMADSMKTFPISCIK